MRPNEVHTVLSLNAPLKGGDFAWDDDGSKTQPVRVVVDLAREMLYVYRGGTEIGRTIILYGADNKPTPMGVFPILNKDADHFSATYDHAPMPWNLRLTWGGVAIHGTEVDTRYATHGCVGVPVAFAKKLFHVARKGDPVLITRNWLPKLYDDKAQEELARLANAQVEQRASQQAPVPAAIAPATPAAPAQAAPAPAPADSPVP